MASETSSFDDLQNISSLLNNFSDIYPIEKNGATSDCSKVRIHGKWHFLKRPKKVFSTNPIYIAAFEKEFDLGYTLDHPNIVRYISKGTDGEGIYILTEYIDGQSLSDFRLKNPDFFKYEENIKKLLLQLLSALDYIHNRQIVHLDLKPDNILITNNGNNIKLIDLGLSYSDCYTEITGGTQSFGSPEQFSTPQLIDYRSDLYAFGKIALYLFTGDAGRSSLRRLPARYKKLVGKCLIMDVERRNIKAIECINTINKKRKHPILLITGVLILLLGVWGVKTKDVIQSEEIQNSQTKDSTPTVIPQNIPVQQNKDNSGIKTNAIETKTAKKRISKDSIEDDIKHVIEKRLRPNISNLSKAYSDINEFNISILKQSFDDWKIQCNEDCKLLYKDYESQISFDQFKRVYDTELNKINSPIQKRLDEFK